MKAVIADMPPRWLAERKNSDAARWDEMWEGVLHVPPMPNGMHQDFELDLAGYHKWHWAKPKGGLARTGVNLTTVEDADNWVHNYRIPDIVLLDAARLSIDKNEYMAGAPLVVVEIRSPGDETYDKLPFYAALGVPEVWVFDRDTKAVELRRLVAGPGYELIPADAHGWHHSPATGVEFRNDRPGFVRARIGGDDATAADLPDQ